MDDNLMIIVMIVSTVLGGLVVGLDRIKKKKPARLNLDNVEAERAELLQEKYNKAVADFNFIEKRAKLSSDKELAERLRALQRIGKSILRQMEKQPDRIALAYKFVDYYQDRAVRMIQKFDELDETQLTTDRVRELKGKIKETLRGLEAAYEEQLEKIVNDQMLSTEAEIRVMEEHLRSEGIMKKDDDVTIEMTEVTPDGSDEKVFEAIPINKGNQLDRVGQSNMPRRARPDAPPRPVIPEDERASVIRQKMIQSMLAIFLGTVGAHKFYQGKTLLGALYFIFSWTTLPTWIGMLEGIRYLFMPIDDFYKQYIKDN